MRLHIEVGIKILLNIHIHLIIFWTARWAIRDRQETCRDHRADLSINPYIDQHDDREGEKSFSSLFCGLQGHKSSFLRIDSAVGITVIACARHVAILREGDVRYRLLTVSRCPCHESKRHVEPKRPTASRMTRRTNDDLKTAASLLYGIFTSTSAILKIESSGCECTSWCLLLILSLRSCIIDAHSSCKSSISINTFIKRYLVQSNINLKRILF